ncbi:MAG: hypothetical protein RI560_11085 [Natronomonas sp.]|nr:hypothetical protein [Natronomonas sp.]
MSTWQRFGVALFSTVALAIAGVLYYEVFAGTLLPLIDLNADSPFVTPIVWLDNLAPVIIAALLLTVWAWVIAGAIQDERGVQRRRVRR